MTTLSKRKVGKTKLEVTELGLGGAPMGGFRATIPDAEAAALIDAAYAEGVRYFDTSPFYGYGRSELRMGAALREKPRDEYVLSTKIGRVLHAMRPGEKRPADFRENGLPDFAPVFDYTLRWRHALARAFASEARTGAYRHRADPRRRFLDHQGSRRSRRAVQDGDGFRVTRRSTSCERPASSAPSVSASMKPTPACASSRLATSTACCWPAATRFSSKAGFEEFLPECVKRNVSVILGGPYNSGILTGGVKAGATHDYAAAPAQLIEKAQKIEAICQRHGVELGAAAMQFPLFHPAVCSVIPGALSVAEVKQNAARLSAKIPGRTLE